MKKLIRLTESDLHRIVKESVSKIVTEVNLNLAKAAGNKAYSKERELSKDPYNNEKEIKKLHRQQRTFDDYISKHISKNKTPFGVIALFKNLTDGDIKLVRAMDISDLKTKKDYDYDLYLDSNCYDLVDGVFALTRAGAVNLFHFTKQGLSTQDIWDRLTKNQQHKREYRCSIRIM